MKRAAHPERRLSDTALEKLRFGSMKFDLLPKHAKNRNKTGLTREKVNKMTPDQLKQLAEVGTVIAGLAALGALAFAMWQSVRQKKTEQIREWQRVVLYNILSQHGELKLHEIKGHYLDSVQQLQDGNLPRSDLQDSAIIREIIVLIGLNVVFQSNDGSYGLNVVYEDTVRAERDNFMLEFVKNEEQRRQ
ncbi:MAG: hypothetical protein AAGM67_16870, partial [Bacteroidota bacterium]